MLYSLNLSRFPLPWPALARRVRHYLENRPRGMLQWTDQTLYTATETDSIPSGQRFVWSLGDLGSLGAIICEEWQPGESRLFITGYNPHELPRLAPDMAEIKRQTFLDLRAGLLASIEIEPLIDFEDLPAWMVPLAHEMRTAGDERIKYLPDLARYFSDPRWTARDLAEQWSALQGGTRLSYTAVYGKIDEIKNAYRYLKIEWPDKRKLTG